MFTRSAADLDVTLHRPSDPHRPCALDLSLRDAVKEEDGRTPRVAGFGEVESRASSSGDMWCFIMRPPFEKIGDLSS